MGVLNLYSIDYKFFWLLLYLFHMHNFAMLTKHNINEKKEHRRVIAQIGSGSCLSIAHISVPSRHGGTALKAFWLSWCSSIFDVPTCTVFGSLEMGVAFKKSFHSRVLYQTSGLFHVFSGLVCRPSPLDHLFSYWTLFLLKIYFIDKNF